MRIYTVHENPDPLSRDAVVFIKEGFCWAALAAPILLPIFQGLWFVVVTLLAVLISGTLLLREFSFSEHIVLGFWVLVFIFYAFEANNFRRLFFMNRGWRMVSIVAGKQLLDAERRFFSFCEVTDDGTLIIPQKLI